MTDQTGNSIRNIILHILSLPKQCVIQQVSLAEIDAVANGFQEIASLLRQRLDTSMSPLKSSENKLLRAKKVQMDECLAKLRRYMTLLCCQTDETSNTTLLASVQAEFKLIHQNINNIDPAQSFSLLMLESSEAYCNGSMSKVVRSKILNGEELLDFWVLKGVVTDENDLRFCIDWSESGINEKVLEIMHQNASPPNFTETIFLLALSTLMIDLIQKSQGIQLFQTPFEEFMALLIDKSHGFGKYASFDFELPDPSFRKRNSDDMDMDISDYQRTPKKFMNS